MRSSAALDWSWSWAIWEPHDHITSFKGIVLHFLGVFFSFRRFYQIIVNQPEVYLLSWRMRKAYGLYWRWAKPLFLINEATKGWILQLQNRARSCIHYPYTSIHPSIHYPDPFGPMQDHRDLLKPIPALFGRKAGVHLDRLPVHRRPIHVTTLDS